VRAQAHLARCSQCSARVHVLTCDELALAVPFQVASSASDASTAPRAGHLLNASELLRALGAPEDLASIAARQGLPLTDLQHSLRELRPGLLGELAPRLALAERQAQEVAGARYEPWKRLAAAAFEHPRPQGDSSKWNFLHAEFVASSRSVRFHAPQRNPEPAVFRLLSRAPTRGALSGDARYRLWAEERTHGAQCTTQLSCKRSPGAPRSSWGFRISFEPYQEARALAECGLSPEMLGVLRLHYGESCWGSLLDLLLPYRFGQEGHPLFDRAAEPVPGSMPSPAQIQFWVSV
jgi:hypothetical protein